MYYIYMLRCENNSIYIRKNEFKIFYAMEIARKSRNSYIYLVEKFLLLGKISYNIKK